MTRYFYILLTFCLTACGTTATDKNRTVVDSIKKDTTAIVLATITNDNRVAVDTIDYNYATFYVVVADTSANYAALHKVMMDMNSKFNIPIDSMGRYYNKTKNLIALPDNDEDEMYAGEYFPRRFPSDNLSLEYLESYQLQAGKKTIALVTGIYDIEKKADSALIVVQRTQKKVFKIKANMYVGCMH